MADLPHFAYPFRMSVENGRLAIATTEQHSDDEIADCVRRIVNVQIGDREELPAFGITELNFQQANVDVERLISEINRWESRAEIEGVSTVDTLDELVSIVRLGTEVAN